MAATYSISTSGQDAVTYTDVTQILSLLPNNTQQLISPRDVRDAVFSNWENAVWRYTTNGTNEYIGFARPEVKDVKLFFGKKQLNNSNILSSGLLSTLSDTDIFFYNTKSDGAASQKLKIAFLGGGTPSLFLTPPFIEVLQNITGTPSLDFNLTHNQSFGGDFNFIAGNNGRISLNGLKIPSQNEFTNIIANAGSASVGDLMMVRSSTGFVELRNINTSTFGNLTFTEANPMLDDFRGFVAGQTFSDFPIEEIIRTILYPDFGPSATMTVLPVLEKNISGVNVNYSYSLTKRTFNILSSQIRITRPDNSPLFQTAGPTITGSGQITNFYNSSQSINGIQNRDNDFFTFSISAFDGTYSTTASARLSFVYPYFYGFSSTSYNISTIQTVVNNDLTKLVDIKNNQPLSIGGYGYLYFAYPSSYGLLNDIVDANGYQIYVEGSVSTSWTQSNVLINSPSTFWSGVSYKVYRTFNPVTIPLPSETYTFNFT